MLNITSYACLFPVLPPPRATNFRVADSRRYFYFLQHDDLLRAEVVIRGTNNRNLQLNICCATSYKEMLPVLLGLKGTKRIYDILNVKFYGSEIYTS